MINALLNNHQNDFGLIIAYDYRTEPLVILDLTKNNRELEDIDVTNAAKFSAYINKKLAERKSRIGIGTYLEDRTIYRSALFGGREMRTVHLGIDLWVNAGVDVFAPLDGVIHSFRNNIGKGDYGPTVILAHQLGHVTFYTLYGHLDDTSLADKKACMPVKKGSLIGKVGNYPHNGDYPPHVHFELITDMQGKEGDFPGVAAREHIEEYKVLCPDPNIILQISHL